MFPIDRYKFYTDNKSKVVAVSTYAQRPVRGVAICSPTDTFNLETGKKLAAARCAEKIATKRLDRADFEWQKASKVLAEANAEEGRMFKYYMDAQDEFVESRDRLCAILKDLQN